MICPIILPNIFHLKRGIQLLTHKSGYKLTKELRHSVTEKLFSAFVFKAI